MLAGVSDNEMQQGTKSWGPPFSGLRLHFRSRQVYDSSMPSFLLYARVFMFACVRTACYVYDNPILLLLLVFCMADPSNVITVSACLIFSRRE